MKFPNKIINYDESILSKFVPILSELSIADSTPLALYKKTLNHYKTIEDFLDALDCLYALNKITYDEQGEILHYVA